MRNPAGWTGWVILRDIESDYFGGFQPGPCYNGTTGQPTAYVPCIYDVTGGTGGAYALVSSEHTVLPGEALSVTIRRGEYPIMFSENDTMHYVPHPPYPLRFQSRLDVYQVGTSEYPLGVYIGNSVFSPTDIDAAPFLGTLVSAGRISELELGTLTTLTISLAPYVGKTVVFAYRAVSNYNSLSYEQVGLTNFKIGC